MSDVTSPEKPDFDEANSKLNEGLRSCRTLISSYRALLSREADNDDEGFGEAFGISND